ncbi:tetratricopeptide repeat protein [Sphingobium xenophagum]|uniref:tetratricopeptide repeat protein n=1 Tax=Sphingobium xenophagum TaxID=121428 RepID=UPI0004748913
MLKVALIAGFALACVSPAMAQSAPEDVIVVGVPDGCLAARDLTAGDYAKAAKRLKAVWPDSANDPARLINLGNAYAGMGRMVDARSAYRSARFSPEMTLVMADGSEQSSRDVARRAMSRLTPVYASR